MILRVHSRNTCNRLSVGVVHTVGVCGACAAVHPEVTCRVCLRVSGGSVEAEARARVRAAAPDLLAALEELVAAIDAMPVGSIDTDEAWGNRVARAAEAADVAIAKARGEP